MQSIRLREPPNKVFQIFHFCLTRFDHAKNMYKTMLNVESSTYSDLWSQQISHRRDPIEQEYKRLRPTGLPLSLDFQRIRLYIRYMHAYIFTGKVGVVDAIYTPWLFG